MIQMRYITMYKRAKEHALQSNNFKRIDSPLLYHWEEPHLQPKTIQINTTKNSGYATTPVEYRNCCS